MCRVEHVVAMVIPVFVYCVFGVDGVGYQNNRPLVEPLVTKGQHPVIQGEYAITTNIKQYEIKRLF